MILHLVPRPTITSGCACEFCQKNIAEYQGVNWKNFWSTPEKKKIFAENDALMKGFFEGYEEENS